MMKIFYFLFLAMIVLSCTNSNDADINDQLKDKLSSDLVENPRSLNSKNQDEIRDLGHLNFADTLHNFGEITEGEIIEYDFAYQNTGKKNVIISDAKAGCGCTIPTYQKEPIKPQESGVIKIKFNSQGKLGHNEKSVEISTNGNPSRYMLNIIVDIKPK